MVYFNHVEAEAMLEPELKTIILLHWITKLVNGCLAIFGANLFGCHLNIANYLGSLH